MKPAEQTRSRDHSRVTHGAVYHALYDLPLAATRKAVVDAVPPASSILEIACGTGELCFDLARQKSCRVVGIDLSPRMIAFARKRNRYPEVRFEVADAADLSGFGADSFDLATILLLFHEIDREGQIAVLEEALRVAPQVIVVDSQVPLPWNPHGIALRIVEVSGGPGHYRPFADYLAAGGIAGILADSRVKASVASRLLFWHGCREMVVLERQRSQT